MRDKASKLKRLPPKPDSWEITPKQVICSELRRAILLFICDDDYLASHLLAGAARDILHRVAKDSGAKVLWDVAKDRIHDQYQKAFYDAMKWEYNFFKHARKSNKRYHPRITEMVIWETCVDLHSVYGENYIESLLYQIWFSYRHPDLLRDELNEKLTELGRASEFVGADGKISRATFKKMLNMIAETPRQFQLPSLRSAAAGPPAIDTYDR